MNINDVLKEGEDLETTPEKGVNVHELLDALSKSLIETSVDITKSVNDIPNTPSVVLVHALSRSVILKDIADVLDKVKARI